MAIQSMTPRVYLAGPDVFLPNAQDIGAAKREICAEFGLVGVFPLDNELPLDGLTPAQQARTISRANEELMRGANAIIANLTPFRGASMDSGTAFEVGFMRALGRPVFGYTNCADEYANRARAVRLSPSAPGDFDDPQVEVEDFGLAENLMIAVAVTETGLPVVQPASNTTANTLLANDDLSQFKCCVQDAAEHLLAHATNRMGDQPG